MLRYRVPRGIEGNNCRAEVNILSSSATHFVILSLSKDPEPVEGRMIRNP